MGVAKLNPTVRSVDVSGATLVALAAALWGTDALFRRGLSLDLPAAAVVLGEHAVLVAVTVPLLVRASRALRKLTRIEWAMLIVIGAGSSAAATILFTEALAQGDPTTPLLLQKLQPAIAMLCATVVLKERLTPRYFAYFVPAVAGAYFITFPDPTSVSVSALAPAALAVGAACLWGLGTVLGRYLSLRLDVGSLTALRFALGLPAAFVILLIQYGPAGLSTFGAQDVVPLVLLALVPGLIALLLYYRGLARTPATLATLGELAFPLTAILINYSAFGSTLTATQWLGVTVLTTSIVALCMAGRQGSDVVGVRVRRPIAPAMDSA
jgi:DME family drug/metabolite transporter